MKDVIFTFIAQVKGSYYPIFHIVKMKTGYKLIDSLGMSYGWFKSIDEIFKYMGV